MKKVSRFLRYLSAVAVTTALSCGSRAHAANGTWTGAEDSMWTNSANWSVSPYAGSNTSETATFDSAGNGHTTLDITGLYSIGSTTFDTANVAAYTIGSGGPNGQTLIIGRNGTHYLTATAGNSQLVNAALQLGGDRTAGNYFFRNENTAETLTFAGNVFSATATGTAGGKVLTTQGAGNIVFSGNLDKGTASALVLTNGCTGTLTISGSNTLTTLYMTGNTNTITDIGSGDLALDNLGSVTLYSTQGGFINGTGKIHLSTAGGSNYGDNYIAAGKTLVINPTLTGNTGFEMWSGTGTLILNGINDFTGNVNLGSAGTLSVANLGNQNATDSNAGAGTTISFGNSNARLLYTGAGETSDRLFTITNATGASVIEHAGSGPLTLTGDITPTVAGSKQLKLQGSTSATGEVAGVFSDFNDTSLNSVYKTGTGTWKLSGNNAFKGAVEINQGVLIITRSSSLGLGSKTVKISNGTAGNPQLHLDGSDGNIVLETNLTFSTSNNDDGPINNIAGTNTIRGNFTMTGGGGGTALRSRAGKLTLSGSFIPDQTSRILYLRGDGDGEVSGAIQNGSTVNMPIFKEDGAGLWTLSGSNTYSGVTTVSSGTLALAGANGSVNASSGVIISNGAALLLNNTADANHDNRLKDTGTVTMNGGTLAFLNDGGAADFSENAGSVSLSAGQNTLTTSQAATDRTSTLTLNALTRSALASLNFTGTGLGESARNRILIVGQADGLIGPAWATVNGTNLAAYSSVAGVFAAPNTDIAARGDTIVSNAASSVRINTDGTTGPIELSAPTTVITSLAQNTATDATVNTADKTLQAASLLINAGKADLTIGVNVNDGTLASPTAGGDLGLLNNSDSALTVNAVIADNATPSSLTKDGTGPAVLAGANTFSGPVNIQQGSLILANSRALQNVMLGSLSGIVFDSSVAGHAFTLGNLTNAFALALADNAANAIALSVGNNNAGSSFGGVVSGSGSLNKVGAGKLTLTGANSFSGGLKISGGTLSTALVGGLGTGGVTNDGTLNLTGGGLAYTGLSTALSGTGTVNVTLSTTVANTTTLGGDYSGFNGTWNLGVGAPATGSGKALMNGTDNSAATVNVLSNGTLYANAAGTHNASAVLNGGNTGEPYGQLRLESNANWAGTVALAGDITDGADGFFGSNSGTGTVSGVISDIGGAHPVDKRGGGVIVFSATNTYAGATWVRGGALIINSLKSLGEASALGAPALPTNNLLKLGTSTTAGTLAYIGSGDTSDRVIDLAGTTGAGSLEQAGTGLFKLTGDLSYSGAGGKTLNLLGSTDGVGELAGRHADGTPYTNKINKSGAGRWILSNANTYSGDTEVTGGTLALAHPNAVSQASLIKFTGYGAVLELASSGVNETTNNISISVGNAGTLASGVPSGNVGMNHSVGLLSLSTVTVNVVRASSVLSGTPSITADSVNLSAGASGTTTLNPTSADLLLGRAAILGGTGSKTLRLDGTSTGNKVTGIISNGISTLSLTKDNASTWTLSGSNTYSGATTINAGTLVLSGADGAIASSSGLTLNSGGTLRLGNTPTENHNNRLRDAAALTLTGGALDFAHAADAASYSETAGAVTLNSAGNTIAASQAAGGQTSALTLTSLTRIAGAAVDFSGAGLGSSDRNRIFISGQPSGLIGLWATVNGTALALHDSTQGVYASAFYDTAIAARGPSSTVPDDATANVRITTSGTSGPIALAGASVNSAALLQQGTATPAVVATAGKTLRTYGVSINAGQESLTVGQLEGDGTLTALAPGGKLDLANDSSSTLTVNAAIADNTSASALNKNGTGDVLLKGACSYSGATLIADGSLTYGSGATQALAGVISGSGSLVKSGTNILQLLASNTYTGPTYINAGIVRANQNATFGSSAGGVFIAPGATLDVGCSADVGGTRTSDALDLGTEVFTVSGTGVDGKGALVNNSTVSQSKAFGKVTLTDHSAVGGTARLDLRQNTPTLTMNGYTLTKKGSNIFGLTSANVLPDSGHIDVQSGTLKVESNTRLNGSVTNTLTVRSGATLELYNLYPQNAPAWSLMCEDQSTLSIALGGPSLSNNWAGPVTLGGTLRLTGGGTYNHALGGVLTGPGSILKYGSTTTYLTNDFNTYSGFTWITNGTLVVSSVRALGQASSLGAPATAGNGLIKLGGGASAAALIYTGTGDTTDRNLDLAGTTGGATLTHAGTGPLKLSGTVTGSGAGAKTLTLTCPANASGEFAGAFSDLGGSRTSITKNGGGTWTLSGNNSYTGDATVAAGTLTLSGTNAQGQGFIVVGSAAANATLNLAPGCQLTSTGFAKKAGGIMIGNALGAHGALYMKAGVAVSRSPGTGDDQAFTIGKVAGAYGYFNMSGGEMNITRIQTGASASGANCIGVVRMTGGTLNLTNYILIARGIGTLSAFTLDGGTVNHTNASDNLSIGYEGGRGELNLTGGTLESFGKPLTVRQSANNPTGIVNLCAGLLSIDTFQNTAPGIALLNFAGGTLKAGNVDSPVFIPTSITGVYDYGPFGTYAGGAAIDTGVRSVTLAAALQAPAGNGVYSITLADQGSGYIGEPYVSIEGSDGLGATAVANMTDDGTGSNTYKVASVTITSPGVSYVTPPTVLFKGGGATAVAPTVGSVSLAANTSGGLTKLGTGILTLGNSNTYAGTTTVNNGTLKLGIAKALPTGTSVVLAGGKLDLNGFTVTNTLSGSGLVTNGTLQTVFSPAGEGVIGTDTLALKSVTVQGTYRADVTAAGASDLVTVQGNINLSNFALQIVDTAKLDRRQQYTILACTGTRTGTFSSTNLPDSRWHVLNLTDGTVKLIFANGTLIRLL